MATNASGVVVSNLRYTPFGSVRWASGALPTNRKFIPQLAALTRDVPPAMYARMPSAGSTLHRCILTVTKMKFPDGEVFLMSKA